MHDFKKSDEEWKKKEDRNRKMLELYRKDFCLDEMEGKKAVHSLDMMMRFADELNEKEKKQKYMWSMIKSIYVRERSHATVDGYIPLYSQAQNIHYEPKCRDKYHTIPTLQFRFSFIAPSPRKSRVIVSRDEKGRIVNSKVPALQI